MTTADNSVRLDEKVSQRKGFMNDYGVLVGVAAVVAGVVAFVVFHTFSGVHGSLSNARVGEVYNFEYEQPLHGDPDRYLAKVLDVHMLDDAQISKLNARSRYRRNDPIFQRTKHLVTCKTADGQIRHFYAERAKNVRRSLLGGVMIKSGLAAMIF